MDTSIAEYKELFKNVLVQLKQKNRETLSDTYPNLYSGWIYMHLPTKVWTRREAKLGKMGCAYIEWGLSVYRMTDNKGRKIHLEEYECTDRDLDSEGKQYYYHGNKRSIIDYKDRKTIRNSSYHKKGCSCWHRNKNSDINLRYDLNMFIRDVNSNDRFHPTRRDLF